MTAIPRHWQACRQRINKWSKANMKQSANKGQGTLGARSVLACCFPVPGGFQCQTSPLLSSLTLCVLVLSSHLKSIKLSQGTDEGKVWSCEGSPCPSVELEVTGRILEECPEELGKYMMCSPARETWQKQNPFLILHQKTMMYYIAVDNIEEKRIIFKISFFAPVPSGVVEMTPNESKFPKFSKHSVHLSLKHIFCLSSCLRQISCK